MKEEWKDIIGYEGLYQVSNLGKVRSVKRTITKANNVLETVSGYILRQNRNEHGYMMVGLCKKGKPNQKRVHRLVAQAFILNTENKKQVNHKNGIKTDNRAENLEWVTSSENLFHAYKQGLKKPFGCKKVLDRLTGIIYPSIEEAARNTGKMPNNIRKCKNAKKSRWSFA